MNLLIVNDDVMTVDTMLSEINWEIYGISKVFVSYHVEGAKKIISKKNIDILLCDIEMPKQNGLELVEWIREEQRKIECIFLTCHANFAYARKAIELGCQNYILTPAKYEDIGNEVKKTVKKIKEEREWAKFQDYGKQVYIEKIDTFSNKKEDERNQKQLVESAVKYIFENINQQELTVNAVAETLYVHPVYLNRIFKKEKGIAISQYVIGERMKMACDILKKKGISLNEVAETVGYSNYSSFHMTFRKTYGCTPAQYREKQEI